MTLKYISIEEVQRDDKTHYERPRLSSLLIADSGQSNRTPDALEVVGNLPHNYAFKPATAADRDAMVDYLSALDYSRRRDHCPTPDCYGYREPGGNCCQNCGYIFI